MATPGIYRVRPARTVLGVDFRGATNPKAKAKTTTPAVTAHQFVPVPGHDKPPTTADAHAAHLAHLAHLHALHVAHEAHVAKTAPKASVKSKPVTTKPAPKTSPPKAQPTATSSPAPGAVSTAGSGGFDLGSLLPLLLIAGALLAGFYLYTHRKG